ncbi:hypothetical protein [Halobacterium wangiae]|nr:hypothetical protein [Halobacterium wangiae]
MTDSTDEPTTWEEPREQAVIEGEKRTIPDQQRREIERRREGQ